MAQFGVSFSVEVNLSKRYIHIRMYGCMLITNLRHIWKIDNTVMHEKKVRYLNIVSGSVFRAGFESGIGFSQSGQIFELRPILVLN